jgi:putative ABC transport system permease protein
MVPVTYNLRSLAVRKSTTFAVGFGLAMVVFVFSGVLMLSNGIKKALVRSAAEEAAIVLRQGSESEFTSGIDEASAKLVLADQNVQRDAAGNPLGVAEVVVVVLLEKLGTGASGNVLVRGVPDNVLAFRPDVRIIEGRAARPGTDEVIVGRGVRGRFRGLDLGASFELKKNRPATVVGVFESAGSSLESEVWADISQVQSAFGRNGLLSSVRVRLAHADAFEAFRSSLAQNRTLSVEALRERDFYDKQSEGTSLFITAMGSLVSFFFGLGAVIGAMITLYGSIASRQKEIGTLRALGFSRRSIVVSFLFESLVIALAGGLVGALASLALGFVRLSLMNFQSFSEIVITFEPSAAIIGTAVVASVLMGTLGGVSPALRAARTNVLDAIRA